ncbi:ABC transporter ATPase [Flammeovirga pectinis]|uniref:ABC transporter ATPase n=1 Tax=Flammeovirga pectinis TaxID=2494373 RepID=A0A3S9P2G3_9BACT|nr:ABC transporter ATPase [Flammeovirga pectinis]AZQ62381.1 ABC transporter ATPase [Flammeovirga pectinis]
MYKSINSLSDDSKIWIYQSNRAFSDQEVDLIKQTLLPFIESWNAHGSDLNASFDIQFNQFIIITVDENAHSASGCSIDKCVGVVKQIEELLNVSLFERTNVAYLVNDKVSTFKLSEAKAMIANETITNTTKIFDNTIQSLGDYKKRWIIEADQSWLKRFFVTA